MLLVCGEDGQFGNVFGKWNNPDCLTAQNTQAIAHPSFSFCLSWQRLDFWYMNDWLEIIREKAL